MPTNNWPLVQSYILALEQSGDAVEDRLKLCERGYAAGNYAALAVALNVCERRKMLPPPWLNNAIKAQLAEQLQPRTKKAGGRHARVLRRVNDMLIHLRRMQLVLQTAHAERISVERAWERVADLLAGELSGLGDPVQAIRRSYRRGLHIVNDAEQREFIAPIYGSDVLLQLWPLLTRKGHKPR